jgi:hypothetical protein
MLSAVVWGYSSYVGAPLATLDHGVLLIAIREDSPWLPQQVQLALRTPAVTVTASPTHWRTLAPGFDVADVAVLADGVEVDRLYLSRVDPAKYRFIVRNDPSNSRTLDDWMQRLHAVAVINGSYFGGDYRPATPVVIDGAPQGPSEYDAKQGAFIMTAGEAHIQDLARQDWRDALHGADEAMVSYPMLIDADGQSRVSPSRWLASRSFVAQDRNGMIILGSTPRGFFSLDRLAAFLKTTPLDLRLVLNLDGGPVACQGVHVRAYRRMVYGELEMRVQPGVVQTLPTSSAFHATMPMILAVVPRTVP